MKRKAYNIVSCLAIILSLFPFFMNCSAPMRSLGSIEVSSVTNPLAEDTPLSLQKFSSVNERALLTADQLTKSMSSVTGILMLGNTATEFSTQSSVLSSSYDLKNITAPMLIGILNLGSAFCRDLTNSENAITVTADRRFYKDVVLNSTTPVSEPLYINAVQALASALWGRPATNDELMALLAARLDFLANINTSEKAASNRNSTLMTFTCTAMIASFESFTL